MNSTTARTALRLLIAAPIAASAIAFGAGVANAGPVGPVIIVATPDDGDPTPGPGDIAQPVPTPDPKPQGPGDIANPKPTDPKPQGPGDIANPKPTDPKPQGPGDIAQPEGDDPKPHGPGDLTNPEPQDDPTDEPADQAQPADEPTKKPAKKVDSANSHDVDQVADTTEDVSVPSRIDAGAALAPVADEDNGFGLTWLLVGGGVVTATGAVAARQRLARRTR